MGLIDNIKNYIYTGQVEPAQQRNGSDSRNVQKRIFPAQLERVSQDLKKWRDAVKEAENSRVQFRFRYKMQRLFADTILNGHVDACLNFRKSLVLQKKYQMVDDKGNVNEEWSKYINEQCFDTIINGILDARFFGYTLLNYTDIESNYPKNIYTVKRENVNPETKKLLTMIYSSTGIPLDDETNEYYPWTMYFDTASETGSTYCGFGLLYKVALYEIICRAILAYNSSYVELFSQPFRVGKTMKTSDEDRGEFEAAIQSMGASAYAIIDPTDEIEFIETKNAGTGWQGYENLEKRCEAKISKILLGHADAIDSTSGKLGSNEEVLRAIKTVESSDISFVQGFMNKEVLPKLRLQGVSIPDNLKFEVDNNQEIEEAKERETKTAKSVADVAETLAKAGLQLSPELVKEKTGWDVELRAVEPEQNTQVRDALNKLYNRC